MSRDALIVGINKYKYLPKLSAPALDAEKVSRTLEQKGEFRVHRLPEAIKNRQPIISDQLSVSAKTLEASLIKLFKPPGKNIPHTALFYYSGHGLQRHAGIQEGFLATTDANPDQGFYGISLFWLRRLLQESPVRQRVIVLDCCHSGEILNFLEADPGATAGTDRLFMAASREYESAYEALDGPHSVFTQALLKGLNPSGTEGGIVTNHHLIKTISHQLKGEIQQPLFESSGSTIVLTRSNGPLTIHAPAKTLVERLQQLKYTFCPYRGSQPFEEEHAEYFFGRESAVDKLIHRAKQSRFNALVGASGSGKTSLLKAGLMHHIRNQGSEKPWQIKYAVPDQYPLRALAEVMIAPHIEGFQRSEQLYQAESFLRTNPTGFGALLQASLGTQHLTTPPRLLLIVDQLETLWLDGISELERESFLSCLTSAIDSPNLPIHIVLGIRADLMLHLEQYPELFAHIAKQRIDLAPMTYEQVKSTIVQPLDKLGLCYDANLIYTLLLDTVGAPGELPLLQQLMRNLWQQRQDGNTNNQPPRLTLDAYAAMGGLRHLLCQQATAFYEALTLEEQALARHIFLSLSEPGAGSEDNRRQINLYQLMTETFSSTAVESMLHRLVEARLIVLDQARSHGDCEFAGQSARQHKFDDRKLVSAHIEELSSPCVRSSTEISVNIAHESLIRNWSYLHQWLNENRQILIEQRRLESAALEWHSRGQPYHSEYLLQGQLLKAALHFQNTHSQWLSEQSRNYIDASRKKVQEQRLGRWVLSCLTPFSLGVGMFTAYYVYSLPQLNGGDSSPLISEIKGAPSQSGAVPYQSSKQQFSTIARSLIPLTDNATGDVLELAKEIEAAQTHHSVGPLPQQCTDLPGTWMPILHESL